MKVSATNTATRYYQRHTPRNLVRGGVKYVCVTTKDQKQYCRFISLDQIPEHDEIIFKLETRSGKTRCYLHKTFDGIPGAKPDAVYHPTPDESNIYIGIDFATGDSTTVNAIYDWQKKVWEVLPI